VKKSKKLLWLPVIPVLAAVGICSYYTAYLPALIRDNEREASKGLKSLTSAQMTGIGITSMTSGPATSPASSMSKAVRSAIRKCV